MSLCCPTRELLFVDRNSAIIRRPCLEMHSSPHHSWIIALWDGGRRCKVAYSFLRAHFCRLRFSLLGLVGFSLWTRGSGVVGRIWLPLFWGTVLLAAVAIYLRIWRARGSIDEVKKIEAQSLYGILPPKLRDWLFS